MLLLAVIYIAFIGLGLPDSLFGTAWPAVYQEWSLPFSYGSFVVTVIYGGTMLSSLLSARMIARFGTNRVAAFSTALTAVAMAGFSLSQHYAALCLLAVPLGIGAGSIDTALNNYVATHFSSRHMSFLHCFYGVGVVASPFILSLVMHGEGGWRNGYRIVFLIQTGIALLLFATPRLWRESRGNEPKPPQSLSLREIAAIPGVKLTWGLFLADCAFESTCGSFGGTYLVETRGLTAEAGARIVMLYYVGLALARFLAGLIGDRLHSWTLVRIGQGFLAAGTAALFCPGGALPAAVGLFLLGFGIGPIFPSLMYLTPSAFGEERSTAIIGTQMAVSSLTSMTVPILCGWLGRRFGMEILPFHLLFFFVFMIAVSFPAGRRFRRRAAR